MKFRYLFACCFTTALLLRPALAASPCDGSSTRDNEACESLHLSKAEAELERYTQAAIHKMQTGTAPVQTLAHFRQAQTEWKKFRKEECNAIYSAWSDGTIRGLMAVGCATRLTENRTYEIWYNWLTFPDSTPPVLPEPLLRRGR
ncbi:lysozyme inhibitor LprI family protein [Gluconobacter sp. OJB]|uniref:lysozyme inhibitor LprI family protein n=1 Tax=Gluconobacter sp. OJB TaxID=3145196 RepID=UPI0031F9BE9F